MEKTRQQQLDAEAELALVREFTGVPDLAPRLANTIDHLAEQMRLDFVDQDGGVILHDVAEWLERLLSEPMALGSVYAQILSVVDGDDRTKVLNLTYRYVRALEDQA